MGARKGQSQCDLEICCFGFQRFAFARVVSRFRAAWETISDYDVFDDYKLILMSFFEHKFLFLNKTNLFRIKWFPFASSRSLLPAIYRLAFWAEGSSFNATKFAVKK